jgi:tol-pal system protein YbgF
VDSAGSPTLARDLQELQAEVREIHGEIEQLTHDSQTQGQRQRQLYQDLDRRLQAIEQKLATPRPPLAAVPDVVPVPPAPSVAESDKVPPSPAPATAAPAAPPPPEKEPLPPKGKDSGAGQSDYLAAFELLKKEKYPEAISAFRKFLEKYPDSSYAGNAQYWLGEAHYVSQKYPEALSAFQTMLKQYPGNAKLPNAQLKIGYIHYEMGNYAKARETLEKVRKDYPDSSVSALAAERLERMRKEGV